MGSAVAGRHKNRPGRQGVGQYGGVEVKLASVGASLNLIDDLLIQCRASSAG